MRPCPRAPGTVHLVIEESTDHVSHTPIDVASDATLTRMNRFDSLVARALVVKYKLLHLHRTVHIICRPLRLTTAVEGVGASSAPNLFNTVV